MIAVLECSKCGESKLLCGNCNRALGLMYDDVESLEHAIVYLKAGGSWQS